MGLWTAVSNWCDRRVYVVQDADYNVRYHLEPWRDLS